MAAVSNPSKYNEKYSTAAVTPEPQLVMIGLEGLIPAFKITDFKIDENE